jgi:hypothetical protein
MKITWMLIPIAGLAAMLALTGCPGGGGPSGDSSGPARDEGGHIKVTNNVPTDDISDLSEAQPFSLTASWKISTSCSADCAISQLVEHDDFFSIAFDLLAKDVKVFSFRAGLGACAIKLRGGSGQAQADTYNKWDPNQMAEVRNLHFTIGKSGQGGEYCVPNGSLWEKVDADGASSNEIIHLRRLDKATGEIIWISTITGWKGTLMAKKSGILHPMACQ